MDRERDSWRQSDSKEWRRRLCLLVADEEKRYLLTVGLIAMGYGKGSRWYHATLMERDCLMA